MANHAKGRDDRVLGGMIDELAGRSWLGPGHTGNGDDDGESGERNKEPTEEWPIIEWLSDRRLSVGHGGGRKRVRMFGIKQK